METVSKAFHITNGYTQVYSVYTKQYNTKWYTLNKHIPKIKKLVQMEAIIKFNLDDPDEARSHLRCIKSLDMACALFDIRQMRKDLEGLEDRSDLTTDNVMSLIFEVFDNHNINTDELIN